MKLQSGWGCGLCRLERAGNFTSKMVYAHGFWQEASVLLHVGLSLGLLEHPPNTAAGQGSDLTAQGGSYSAFQTAVWDITPTTLKLQLHSIHWKQATKGRT